MIEAPAIDPTQAPPEARPQVLAVEGLTVYFNGAPAIEEITFALHAGDQVAIIGPNGAGKSTLMKTIMGLLQPQAGSVHLRKTDHLHLGYVPQHEGVDWTFPVTVRDVVMMGMVRQIGWLRRAGRSRWAAVDAALERVGMADLGGRQIGDLSGGQRRRVFIARALAQQANVLLLDEPFSGVDTATQSSLMDTLDELNRDGLTILLSTHDLGLAFRRFERVLALNRQLVAYGPAAEVYQPAVLARLYGGQLATWQDGHQVMVFVDDHHCADC